MFSPIVSEICCYSRSVPCLVRGLSTPVFWRRRCSGLFLLLRRYVLRFPVQVNIVGGRLFSFSLAPLSAVLALVCVISTSYWQQLFSGGLDAIDDSLHAAQEYQSLQLGLAVQIHQLWLSWLHVSLSSSSFFFNFLSLTQALSRKTG